MMLSGRRRAVVDCGEGQHIEFELNDDKAEAAPLTALCLSFVAAADRPASLRLRATEASMPPQDASPDVDPPTLQFSRLNQEFTFWIVYAPDVMENIQATRLVCLIDGIYRQFVTAPERPMSAYTLVSDDDAQRLDAWRGPLQEDLLMHTLPELIERQCADRPTDVAVRSRSRSLTYSELRSQFVDLAWRLNGIGVEPGMTVAVYMPRSIELYVALCAVLRMGAVIAPLDVETPDKRLTAILARLRPAVVLTTGELRRKLPPGLMQMAVDEAELPTRDARGPVPIFPGIKAQAYILFTSGSTGMPKGVVTSHAAFANRVAWMQQAFRVGPSDVVLQKTPLGFDVFLWEVFLPLASGACLAVLEPGAHRDMVKLREAAVGFDTTIMHFVPTMLRLFLNEPTLSALPSLRHLICSGEALSRNLSDASADRLGIRPANLYGPTEAAIDVTWWPADRHIPTQDCPIGFPISNLEVSIRDRFLRRLPIGAPGEICISGVGLADGYLNDAALTERNFVNVKAEPGVARIYRSGDIGRHLEGGELLWLGRQDSQIKIGGVRVELAEVEMQLACCPGVLDAVAQATGTGENITIQSWVLMERSGATTEAALAAALARVLPSPAIPARIHLLDRFPVSANGKADRHALLEAQARGEVGATPSVDASAAAAAAEPPERIRSIWLEVLGTPDLDEEKSFFAQGGTSLRAILLVSKIRAELGLDVGVSDIFHRSSFAGFLARTLDQPKIGPSKPGEEVSSRQSPALSDMQRRLWLSQMREEGSRRFNLPFALEMPAQYRERLERRVAEVLETEPVLRSRIVERAGVPTLEPIPAARAPLRVIDLASRSGFLVDEAFTDGLGAPFRLDKEPAARVALATSGDRLYFLLCVHHIVFDEHSWNLLVAKICAGLTDEPLRLSPISPTPTASKLPVLKLDATASRAFWAARLDSSIEPITAPSIPMVAGPPQIGVRRHTFQLDAMRSEEIQCFLQAGGHSPSSFFLSGFGLFLCEWADVEGATVCVSASTRTPQDFDRTGFFVNLLPIIVRPDWLRSVEHLIGEVSRQLGDALDHRFLPFDEILADCIDRLGHCDGLDELGFVYRELSPNADAMHRLDVGEISLDEFEARFFLKFDVSHVEDGFLCHLIGDGAYFSHTLLTRMSGRLNAILVALSPRRDMPLDSAF